MKSKISCALLLVVMCLFLGSGQAGHALDDDEKGLSSQSSTQVEDDGRDT